ncbi:MAG: Mur ligase family protein [Gammaproteobacteria bacterium]|nr:Mur ligase family protein [Gammaproteobacteria bacterium]MDH4253057.1 Mur ligase family protein [Gammaproteobacteria bacterium]MDH5308521.1 Mur ligase family protein [Gammaproteobacteria bacterium]
MAGSIEFIDARRLTGPNLLSDQAGAVMDLRCGEGEERALIERWAATIRPMLDALSWSECETSSRIFSGGVSVAFAAPIDALYAATAANEWAWQVMEAGLRGGVPPDFGQALAAIRAALDGERNPSLLALRDASAGHGTTFLWDDDFVSVGLGRGSVTWPVPALPEPATLDWSKRHDVPVGIVTGTNGKTTTTRLATHILAGSGRNVGVSCTEWIAVNDRIIDRGDWSGPGGARSVLRQTDVDVAVLETARGGLLRRGLGVERADVALITNIAEDHLGDFGSRNLDELLDVKWIVTRAVEATGLLVLNADDPVLRARAGTYAGRLAWFSLDAASPIVAGHVAGGGKAWVLEGDRLLYRHGKRQEAICTAGDVPLALGGVARHNLANALAAAALTHELGASLDDIRRGLTSMSQRDNPGRSNIYQVGDVRVLMDFAHNPHALQALFEMARRLPASRRLLAFGQAGDRPDPLIRELARRAWSIGLDRVIVSELANYYRGRNPGEVYGVIRDELLRCGARPEQVGHFEFEVEALQAALDWAEPGDLLIILALGDPAAIRERLEALSAK